MNAVNKTCLTPLLLCVLGGDKNDSVFIAESLLKNKADLSFESDDKKNVFHAAVEWGARLELINLLINNCDNSKLEYLLNGKTSHGDTPLSIAIATNKLNIAACLVDSKRVIQVQSKLQSKKRKNRKIRIFTKFCIL